MSYTTEVRNVNSPELPWFLGQRGIEAYQKADNFVVLDWETTNKQFGTASNPENRLVLGCWRVVKGDTYVDKHIFGDEYDYQELLDDIAEADFLVAHNAQFELSWLSRCGLDLRSVLCYCTLAGEWVIQGNLRAPLSLETIADKYALGRKGSLVSRLIDSGVCPSEIPSSWLLAYCRTDVDLCHRVFLEQYRLVTELELWPIVLSRNVTIPALADIHLAGLYLDGEAVLKEEARLTQVIEELGDKLDATTGGINLGSTKQLGELLYKTLGFAPVKNHKGEIVRTPTGALSTNQNIIAQLKPSTVEQATFLKHYFEYNTAVGLLSKNVAFFKQVVLDKKLKGKYHSVIAQGRTGTHRLAGAGIGYDFVGLKKPMKVQAQNLPRQYKKFFTCKDRENYVVLEADGAGMEFRTATIIGRDEAGKEDILRGADIHAVTRDTMNAAYKRMGIKKELTRQEAKAYTFGPLYGGNGKDKAEREYVKFFREKYKGISETQKLWTHIVADQKELRTPWGMRYYWPRAKMEGQNGYVTYTTEIYNYPIQGLATAEIIPVALVHFWHRIKGKRIEIFNTVHDSIVSRVHKEELEEAKRLCKVAMTTDVYNFFRDVYEYPLWDELPLGVGLKYGPSWGVSDTEEIYEVWQNGRERLTVEQDKQKKVIYDTGEVT